MRLPHLNDTDYVRVPQPLCELFDEENTQQDAFYVMGVPPDGSCLLHAILTALSTEYCLTFDQDAKHAHALRLRRTLSRLLQRGELRLAEDEEGFEVVRELVQRELADASAFLGQEVAMVLSQHYDVNMFVVELQRNGHCRLLPDFTRMVPGRPSMVLLFRDRHYEPIVCLQKNDAVRLTGTFHWHDPLIQKLRIIHALLSRHHKTMQNYSLDFEDLCLLGMPELVSLYRHVRDQSE